MFDIIILEIDDGLFEVKLINGDMFFGGEDFDMCIVQYLVDEFKKEYGVDLIKDKMVFQCLKEVVEKVKIELLFLFQIEINQLFILMDKNIGMLLYMVMKLICVKLESFVVDLIKCMMKLVQDVLKDVGLLKGDIDEIVLVGGMICMFKVIEVVSEFFGKELYKGVNFDEVVVLGVVIQVGVLQGDVKDVVLLDVMLFLLGIEMLGGVFICLIDCNIMILIKKLQIFLIVEDNQNVVMIWVFQGECEMVVDNKLLGQFNLEDILFVLCGMLQIEVIFDIDVNGIVLVSVKDKGIGKEQNIIIQVLGGLLDDEISQMVKDVEVNVEVDKKCKELVEVCNQGESLIYLIKKLLEEYGDKVDGLIVEVIELVVGVLEDVLKIDDVGKIKGGIQNLMDVLMKLGEVIYKVNQLGDDGDDVFWLCDENDEGIVDVDFEDFGEDKCK